MVNFKFNFGQTVLDVSENDSLQAIDVFLFSFEGQSFNPEHLTAPLGYPVYCGDQQIGWAALMLDDVGCLATRHYRLDRTELQNRWDVRDFYKGEYDNKAPF